MFIKIEESVGSSTEKKKPTAKFIRIVDRSDNFWGIGENIQKEYEFDPPLFDQKLLTLSLNTCPFDTKTPEVAAFLPEETYIIGQFDSIESCISSFGYNIV